MRKRGFTKADTTKVVETFLAEKGHIPASVFDSVQGITAIARTKSQQVGRLNLEGRAKKLIERAA